MRKVVTIICFALSVLCGDLWGATEYSIQDFTNVSESTRNLLKGYVRCGSLIKPLVPTSETPTLTAIQSIGGYSRDLAAKAQAVKKFLDSLDDTIDKNFSDECGVANPTLKLSHEKSCKILALLRRDLEVWLKDLEIFLKSVCTGG